MNHERNQVNNRLFPFISFPRFGSSAPFIRFFTFPSVTMNGVNEVRSERSEE